MLGLPAFRNRAGATVGEKLAGRLCGSVTAARTCEVRVLRGTTTELWWTTLRVTGTLEILEAERETLTRLIEAAFSRGVVALQGRDGAAAVGADEAALESPADAVRDVELACVASLATTKRPATVTPDRRDGSCSRARVARLPPVRRLDAANATSTRPVTQPTRTISRPADLRRAL